MVRRIAYVHYEVDNFIELSLKITSEFNELQEIIMICSNEFRYWQQQGRLNLDLAESGRWIIQRRRSPFYVCPEALFIGVGG